MKIKLFNLILVFGLSHQSAEACVEIPEYRPSGTEINAMLEHFDSLDLDIDSSAPLQTYFSWGSEDWHSIQFDFQAHESRDGAEIFWRLECNRLQDNISCKPLVQGRGVLISNQESFVDLNSDVAAEEAKAALDFIYSEISQPMGGPFRVNYSGESVTVPGPLEFAFVSKIEQGLRFKAVNDEMCTDHIIEVTEICDALAGCNFQITRNEIFQFL